MNNKTVAEVAKMLKCTNRTIQRHCKKLGFRKIGSIYLLNEKQIALVEAEVHSGPGRP
jgi:excisionase family DNA binding protein